MATSDDIRWHQRFSNYRKAFTAFEKGVMLSKERELSELEEQGLIQGFEYTYELAWNVMKDYVHYQSGPSDGDIKGSRDAIRQAYAIGLITDGKEWMNMIGSRIDAAHSYD